MYIRKKWQTDDAEQISLSGAHLGVDIVLYIGPACRPRQIAVNFCSSAKHTRPAIFQNCAIRLVTEELFQLELWPQFA